MESCELFTGYSDGTVRMFDLKKMEMVLKMHPHASRVTAIIFSSDGRCTKKMSMVGSSDTLNNNVTLPPVVSGQNL